MYRYIELQAYGFFVELVILSIVLSRPMLTILFKYLPPDQRNSNFVGMVDFLSRLFLHILVMVPRANLIDLLSAIPDGGYGIDRLR
jgi:hypothetical protein